MRMSVNMIVRARLDQGGNEDEGEGEGEREGEGEDKGGRM